MPSQVILTTRQGQATLELRYITAPTPAYQAFTVENRSATAIDAWVKDAAGAQHKVTVPAGRSMIVSVNFDLPCVLRPDGTLDPAHLPGAKLGNVNTV